MQALNLPRALAYAGSLCWGAFLQPCWGSLLSTQEAGGDGIDWGDDAALQITVLDAGTQGKCSLPEDLAEVGAQRCPYIQKQTVHCQDRAAHTCFLKIVMIMSE